MNEKLSILQKYMNTEEIDLVYIDEPNIVAYFTGFESDPHERIVAYIVSQNDQFLFVPSLEKNEALKRSNVANVYSYSDEENPWLIIQEKANGIAPGIKKVSIDQQSLTVERYLKLQEYFGTKNFTDIGAMIEQMRLTKTEDEIAHMIKAGELADEAFEIGISMLKEGITEQEVAATIDMEMKKRGVSEMSFSTLVLFGDHAASPHGNPGSRQLKAGEFVLFDLGVIYNGYASDATRTVAFGDVSAKDMEIYQIVLSAQEAAQQVAKPGVRAGDLDKIARKVITDAGYGEYFNHRLGHGIGKTAHEFPSIHGDNDTILQTGMCFSIEPGVYIADELGVRIEDCIYLTEDGCEPFTKTTKELQTITVK